MCVLLVILYSLYPFYNDLFYYYNRLKWNKNYKMDGGSICWETILKSEEVNNSYYFLIVKCIRWLLLTFWMIMINAKCLNFTCHFSWKFYSMNCCSLDIFPAGMAVIDSYLDVVCLILYCFQIYKSWNSSKPYLAPSSGNSHAFTSSKSAEYLHIQSDRESHFIYIIFYSQSGQKLWMILHCLVESIHKSNWQCA